MSLTIVSKVGTLVLVSFLGD